MADAGAISLEAPCPEAGRHPHVAQFYGADRELAREVAASLAATLRAGGTAVFVATEVHAKAIAACLASAGADLARAMEEGRYVALDASTTLGSFQSGGRIDPGRFDEVVGGLLRRVCSRHQRVLVFGEMVALLWERGHVSAAIELERLWESLLAEIPFSLLCAYPASVLTTGEAGDVEQVLLAHSAVALPVTRDGTVAGLAGPAGSQGDRAGRCAAGSASRSFPPAADQPRAARNFVQSRLGQWGAEDLAEDAALVVTELATNAVVHAQSEFCVVVSATPAWVRISVGDSSPASPSRKGFVTASSSGRGLGLVSAVAARWGTARAGPGKVVWAELRR